MNVALGLSLTLLLAAFGRRLPLIPPPPSLDSRSRAFSLPLPTSIRRGTRGAGKAREAEAGARKTDTLRGAVRCASRSAGGSITHSLVARALRLRPGPRPNRSSCGCCRRAWARLARTMTFAAGQAVAPAHGGRRKVLVGALHALKTSASSSSSSSKPVTSAAGPTQPSSGGTRVRAPSP